MDRSQHTVTRCLSDEKTQAAISIKLLNKPDHMNNSLYEVELAKAQIENKEVIIVRFFIFQYAKLRMLGLYYNFSTKFCDVNKFKVLETDTDSLYLAFAEKQLNILSDLNELVEVSIKWLRRSFHCYSCSKFLPPSMLCKTQAT